MSDPESSRLTYFDPQRVSFGRHETFPLRYGWLTKGLCALAKDHLIFDSDDATIRLGVGKNMVHAMRYWLLACGVAQSTKRGLESTALGDALFGRRGWDPYLEDEGTIWLLHWLLASNPSQATLIHWFFNQFHKPEFTSAEVVSGISTFVKERVKSAIASTTLKHDVALLLRMYVRSSGNKKVPAEEALDSPLSTLGLIQKLDIGRTFRSMPEVRPMIPREIVGFAMTEVFIKSGQRSLTVETLMRGDGWLPGIGSVFRLSEESLITKLEEVIAWLPANFEIRDTAGIRQVYQLAVADPLSVLGSHYSSKTRSRVAWA